MRREKYSCVAETKEEFFGSYKAKKYLGLPAISAKGKVKQFEKEYLKNKDIVSIIKDDSDYYIVTFKDKHTMKIKGVLPDLFDYEFDRGVVEKPKTLF